tara:strand:+ start:30 stop:260 length:231 start_codon:yes stop_codon:yes gene_type:complete
MGWETTPFKKEFIMEMVKLVKGDRVIERSKVDYENNKGMWGIRGWSLADNKPKPEPTPKAEPKKETVKKTTTKKAK